MGGGGKKKLKINPKFFFALKFTCRKQVYIRGAVEYKIRYCYRQIFDNIMRKNLLHIIDKNTDMRFYVKRSKYRKIQDKYIDIVNHKHYFVDI